MERRHLLRLLTAGLSIPLAPLQLAQAAQSSGRRLILVELSGANDGLNTVVPLRNDRYRDIRPSIALGSDDVFSLHGDMALNRRMRALMSAWNDGDMAVVQGLGYPDQNRSHFKSIALWENGGDGRQAGRNGWLTDDIESMGQSFDAHGISLDGGMGVFASSSGLWLSLTSLRQLKTLKDFQMNSTAASDSANPALALLMDRADTLDASMTRISKKIAAQPHYSTRLRFGNGDLSRQAALAARLIAADVDAPVLKLKISGFDTHEYQLGDHGRLLEDLAQALADLRTALRQSGHWDTTMIMTYSEFGRRATENRSSGTDHGTAAPHFLLGGSIRGGLYGEDPDLENLEDGDLRYTLDYRSLYDLILARWFGLNQNRFSNHAEDWLYALTA
ncbi:MAG: DUF1501 domain-containing protein [Alphaproteobacteria bacterium TMED89]|nr:twin-arginine translocation pathway signal protein [Rhodospirillaceae bacterium]RPH16199.1 MAG: DUF1501 domain-containing protein [Alphaproteobacteria bacterium TMED89]